MHAPPLSRLIRFLFIAAGLIIVLSVLWHFVGAGYSDFLANLARGVVSAGVTVEQSGGTITFSHSIPLMGGYLPVTDWVDTAAIQFGLILTISLVAATPGMGWQRRLAYLVSAAVISFVLQVISVLVMAKTFNSLFFVVVSDLFPLLLWALFALRYLFQQPPSQKRES
jgi:hypothetical protein